MNNTEFYQRVADILQTTSLGEPFPHYKRTRWNQRVAGQGRFEGRGIVRCFGSQVHIALVNPQFSRVCDSKQQALDTLKELVR